MLDDIHFQNDELSSLIAKKNKIIDKVCIAASVDAVESFESSSPSGFSDISPFLAENSDLRDQVKNLKSVIAEMNLKIDELSLENASLRDPAPQKIIVDSSSSDNDSVEALRNQITSISAKSALATRQLHQVQEELQYYFLLSRSQSNLLKKHEALQQLTISNLLDRQDQ